MSHENVPRAPVAAPRAGRCANAMQRLQIAQRSAEQEARRAQELIGQFIRQATELGIQPEPLRVQLSDGSTARTDRRGWYIKRNRTVAIGSDGGYYICIMAGGLKERITGVRLKPSRPELRVSRGGRDGETGDLADFLIRRLRDYAAGSE